MVALVGPGGITKAADGNLWFAETGANRIGRITPAGVVSEFPLPAKMISPQSFTLGPDGNLWFTAEEQTGAQRDATTPVIARMTLAGAVKVFSLPSTVYAEGYLTAGPDGDLWFSQGNQIVRLTTSGAATLFATPKVPPTAGSGPNAPDVQVGAGPITSGPDGAMWFLSNQGRVYRVTTAGAFTGFAVPGLTGYSSAITAGPDGALWFTESPDSPGATGKVGRLTTAGVLTEFNVPGLDTGNQITAGPDGNLWVGDSRSSGTNTILRVTPKGVATSFALPGKPLTLSGLTAGPDGNLWLTESEKDFSGELQAAVLKISPGGSITPFPFPRRTTFDPNVGVSNLGAGDITTGPTAPCGSPRIRRSAGSRPTEP